MTDQNKPNFTVIYDGDCGFCMRSLNYLRKTDVRKVFSYLDFHDEVVVRNRFPSLAEVKSTDFESAMYVVDPKGLVFRGFFAFRRLIWASPLLWILIPFFYFPGARLLGPKTYAWVANNRSRLSSGSACSLKPETKRK
jgi:predicted DCC family thiol-disulfide oxidoreductase YuxK